MIDIIIIVLLLLGTYLGYSRGMVRQLFNIVAVVLGYIVSFALSSRLALIFFSASPASNELVNKFNDSLAGLNISAGYYKIIAFFLIFFIVRFGIQLVGNMLGLVAKLPVINTANKLLGAVLGFVEIYLIIFVCIYLVFVLQISAEFHQSLINAKLPVIIFEQTPILSEMVLEKFFNYVKS